MEKKQIIEIIAKDAREVSDLTGSFLGYRDVPPIYLDLTMAKVKHLYAELLLLKEKAQDIDMEHVEQLLKEKQPSKNKAHQHQPPKEPHSTPDETPKAPLEGETEKKPDSYDKLNKKREEHFLATQLKHDPIKDIKKAISLNEKIWFIKELFDGDIETYNNTLAQLNQFDFLEKAIDFLDRRFDWDYENQTVRDFMEFVYRRFI